MSNLKIGFDLLSSLSDVVFYVSGGTSDFRPLVFYSHGFRSTKHFELADIKTPFAHVYSCLGGDALEHKLFNLLGRKVIFDDERTSIAIVDYNLMRFDLGLSSESNSRLERGTLFSDLGADGFNARVKMTDKRSGYEEFTNLVYLLAENIQTFDAFVKARPKSVRHLLATCEGLAFGGCRKSILEHLFADGAYTRLHKFGFGLDTVVVPARGQAHRHFQHGVDNGMIRADKIGSYIGGLDQVYGVNSTC